MRVLGLVAICEILVLEVAEEELLCARTGAAAKRGSEDVPGHVRVTASRFEFERLLFGVRLSQEKGSRTLAVGFAQQERAWWRWR